LQLDIIAANMLNPMMADRLFMQTSAVI
jgi:hypothetical protein